MQRESQWRNMQAEHELVSHVFKVMGRTVRLRNASQFGQSDRAILSNEGNANSGRWLQNEVARERLRLIPLVT